MRLWTDELQRHQGGAMNSLFAFVFTILGLVAIGAYLVVNDHPWFGLLVMLMTLNLRYRNTTKNEGKRSTEEPQP